MDLSELSEKTKPECGAQATYVVLQHVWNILERNFKRFFLKTEIFLRLENLCREKACKVQRNKGSYEGIHGSQIFASLWVPETCCWKRAFCTGSQFTSLRANMHVRAFSGNLFDCREHFSPKKNKCENVSLEITCCDNFSLQPNMHVRTFSRHLFNYREHFSPEKPHVRTFL